MINLAAGDTIAGLAESATTVTVTIAGMELSGSTETYKVLYQGQPSTGAATLYTVPGSTVAFIKSIHVVNTNAGATKFFQLFRGGTAGVNALTPQFVLPAGGSAEFGNDGWKVYNAAGQVSLVGATGATGNTGSTGPQGPSVSDGDKGDITVSGTGATWTIDNNVVTYAKMQDVSATDRLLGRDTAAAGDTEELTVGGGLEFTGSGGIQRSALTGDITSSAGSNATTLAAGSASNLNSGTLPAGRMPAHTGDVTSSAGSVALALAAGSASVLNSGTLAAGRMPALTGDVTTSAGAVATTIANDAVTYAKMQNVSATDRLLGRDTAAAGDTEELTVSGGLEFTGSGGIQRSALTGDITASAGSNATTLAAGSASNLNSGTLPAGRMPALTGDITTSAGAVATTLAAAGPGATGPLGSATVAPIVTIDAKGRVTGLTSATIAIPESAVTNLVSDLAAKAPIASPTFTGITTAPEFSASGLTGAVQASRYVGAVTTTAPASGTFAVGDYVISQAGKVYVCTSAGTPGTWTDVGGGTGLTDGDKGDVTVSASGATWTIDNDAVTYAKMQNVSATDRLLGRDTAAAGDTEELTVGGGLEFTGSGGIQRSALTGDVTATAGSNATTLAAGSASNLNSGTLAAGRMPALTGDITTSAGAVATTIANNAVTYAKMQDISATDRLLGRDTAAAGDTEELTVGGGLEFTGSGGIQRSALTGDITASAGSNATTLAAGSASNLNAGTLAAARLPALTGDVTTSAGSAATTLAAGSASNLNSGTLPAGRLPALTGDVTTSAGSAATTLAAGSASNLNSGTLPAGRLPALTGDVTTSAGSAATTVVQASGAFALTGDISPAQITSNQNDYNPASLSTSTVLRLNTDASRDMTGISGGADGRVLNIDNVGSFNIVLKHDVTSTAANRFFLPGSTDYIIVPNSGVELRYDGTSSRWRAADAPYQSHNDTYHTNVTRSLFIPARTFSGQGSPAGATSGTDPNQFAYYTLADAATSGGFWIVGAPSDIAAATAISIRIVWTPTATVSSSAVRWTVVALAAVAGADLTGTGTTTTFTGTSGTHTIALIYNEPATQILASVSQGDLIRLNVQRIGADGADTYTNSVRWAGVWLDYTAVQ